MSKFEDKIEEILRKEHIIYEREVSFPDLKGKKPLRFDFGIYKYNALICLIECQGPQHYTQVKQFQSTKSDFMKQ